ncbi:MAG TPA: hypothetical protein VGY97_11130 [Solirubrobacteraceae bacterium]|nr:hypothetical protein [Solirubrobacteraceae bacterium]
MKTLAQTATVSFRWDGARVFGPARAPVYGQGQFDFRSGRGSLVIDLPELRHQEPGTEHALLLPAQVFLQPKATATAVLPRGKPWLLATISGSESVKRNFPQFVGQVEGVNPVFLVDELSWGATAAQSLGGRRISGVPLHEYRVSVDLARALSGATGPAAPASSLAIQEQLTAVGSGQSSSTSPTVPILVWIDRAGRVVQLQASLPGAGEGTAVVTVRSFGDAVRIAAPPPTQVIDITSLSPSGERENNGGGDSDGA